MADELDINAQELESACAIDEQASQKSKIAFRVLLILCTTGWGFSLGVLVWRPKPPAIAARPKSMLSNVVPLGRAIDSGTEQDSGPLTIRDLHLIDVMLEHGNVAHAMNSYSRIRLERGSKLYDQLTYRICVARELLGQWEAAGKMYRDLTGQAESDTVRLAARLGQARLWIKEGQPHMARAVLAQAKSGPIVVENPASLLAGEVGHLLAQSYMPQASDMLDRALEENGVVTVTPSWSADDLLALSNELDETEQTPISPKPPDAGAEEIRLTYAYGSHPEEKRISAVGSKSRLVVDLVEQLAKATDTKIEWSDAAKANIYGRSHQLISADVSLAIALDELLTVFDLLWQWQDDRVLVLAPTECKAIQKEKIIRRAAGRLLRRAISEHPDHPLAAYSYLALGDLNFRRGNYAGAIAMYRQFEEQFPRTAHVVVAQFNTSKALLALGDRDDAIQSFFRVADGGHGHPLQSAANTYAGRLFLENGQVTEATRPLIRAVSTAKGAHRAVPAVMLASAYMLADNSHAAVQTLMEERNNILHSSVRPSINTVAAFITSYAGFLVTTNEFDITQQGRQLIQSLSRLEVDDRIGSHLLLVVGDGYDAVGLMSRMEEAFAAGLKRPLSPWVREQVQLRLVDSLVQSGQIVQARQWLEDSMANHDGPLSVDSTLQLANLCVAEGQQDEAMAICRELLSNDLTSDQKGETLLLMGQIYQADFDHYQAALCFAGMLPGDSNAFPNANPTNPANEEITNGGVMP